MNVLGFIKWHIKKYWKEYFLILPPCVLIVIGTVVKNDDLIGLAIVWMPLVACSGFAVAMTHDSYHDYLKEKEEA